MKRVDAFLLTLGVWLVIGLAAQATDNLPEAPPPSGAPQNGTDSLTSWQYYQEVTLPADPGQAKYYDYLLSGGVFGKAREDYQDLRLYAGNQQVPYALRVLKASNEQTPLPNQRSFNPGRDPDRSAQLSVDLEEKPMEHNQIDITTGGTNFRRQVKVEGSDNTKDWSALPLDRDYLVRYQLEEQRIDTRSLHYPASRYRYLRIHVFPDTGNPQDTPDILSAIVSRTTKFAGEMQTTTAHLGPRQAERIGNDYGSKWAIDFGGDPLPCMRLTLTIEDEDFSRPYQVVVQNEATDAGSKERGWNNPSAVVASGVLSHRAGSGKKDLEIEFQEVRAGALELLITDQSNPPLHITKVEASAPARQVIFARTDGLASPVRLYFGNPNAPAPGYDFDRNLGSTLPPAARAQLVGSIVQNPTYQPQPKPWTERYPWLIYVVLGLASVVLLGILGLLAREAIRRHDAAEAAA